MTSTTATYRGMDRTQLDVAYDNVAAVGQAARDQLVASWQERSKRLRAAHPEHLDLRYGSAERARIDFFSAGRDGAPTLRRRASPSWRRARLRTGCTLRWSATRSRRRHACRSSSPR
jgi:hypothetical protein